jgi:general L-amino acid transport system permease protein
MTTSEHPGMEIQPPSTEVGVLGWLKHNLFNSKSSGVATIVVGTIVVVITWLFLTWAIQDARWGVITTNMQLFLVGLYPPEEIWRVWVTMLLMSVLSGLSAGTWGIGSIRILAIMLAAGQLTIALMILISDLGMGAALALVANAALVVGLMPLAARRPVPRRWLVVGWLVSLVLIFVLLYGLGEATPLPAVSPRVWGGLLLTVMLSAVAILLSFPIGVALAVGRRSSLPVVKWLSTAVIEVVRAVPLITILFMATLLVPLFLPENIRIDNVIRAMAGLTIFTAAYVAENVRGGLQAIPNGQIEAAQAVGLRGWQINLYIVLPQALRITIPANVGQFISLMKDTTLVVIIGLIEILGIGRQVLAQPEWLGASFEVYVFVAAVFFVLSYTLSQASYRLEKELGIGER